MYELKVITHFAAAHQLKMVSKKCENLHGHNWKVEVHISGKKLNDAGVLIDFGEIKMHLSKIIDTLDHKYLNELEQFNENPSSECIAHYIATKLQTLIAQTEVKVSRVRVWESEDASATYIVND